MTSRRAVLIVAAALPVPPALGQRRTRAEAWRDPHCGCCLAWVEHLRAEGFAVEDRVVPSVAPFRRMLGTPADLLSCHAGRVEGMGLEGHVPALAIRRLLAARPAGVVGLAVPAMPIGSPGMEVPGQPPDTYDVIAWRADGSHQPSCDLLATSLPDNQKEKVMRKLSMFTAVGIFAVGLAGTAFAQAPAPAGAVPHSHHPEAPAGAPQPAPPAAQRGTPAPGMMGPGGGMMGGDMGRMMQPMMQQMMQGRMAAAAMQPFRRIEGQLAYFRAELRITDAQAQPWNAFADAVRAQAERLRQATQQAMSGAAEPGPAPQQMERRIALLAAHLEAMRAVAAAATPLYAALSEEQRRSADELMAEHLRGMQRGMRMGMQ